MGWVGCLRGGAGSSLGGLWSVVVVFLKGVGCCGCRLRRSVLLLWLVYRGLRCCGCPMKFVLLPSMLGEVFAGSWEVLSCKAFKLLSFVGVGLLFFKEVQGSCL